VDVQLVHGRLVGEDELTDTAVESLELAETYAGGRHRFEGAVELDHAGGFGYTVRIVPQNALLASPAELGVVALPA
jgi:starch phosphorylase